MREAAAARWAGVRAWVARHRSPPYRLPPRRYEEAVQAVRLHTLALALAVFIIGFSLADLQVLRLPSYLLGVLGALVLVAFGPLLAARRIVREMREAEDDAFHHRLQATRRRGRMELLLVAFGFVVWMVFFAAGVPAWAA